MDLTDTPIKHLPDGLIVGGCLVLHNTPFISYLPKDLVVANGISADREKITSLPEGLRTGDLIFGVMQESSLHYTKLEDGNWIAGKYLYCNHALTHIVAEEKTGEYTYYVGKYNNRNVIFDGKNYICCKNFEEGVATLVRMKNRSQKI